MGKWCKISSSHRSSMIGLVRPCHDPKPYESVTWRYMGLPFLGVLSIRVRVFWSLFGVPVCKLPHVVDGIR